MAEQPIPIELRDVREESELRRCHRLVRELRPHLDEDGFVARVEAQRADGFHLLVAWSEDQPVGAVGYRFGAKLAWGEHCYVDDLIVDPTRRSRGVGHALMAEVRRRAIERGCEELHLDSRRERSDAHRFYEREGLAPASLHFRQRLRGT